VNGGFFLHGLAAADHFLVIYSLILKVDPGHQYLIGLSVHTQYLSLSVLVFASDNLHEIILDYVPTFNGFLGWTIPKETLGEHRVEEARRRGIKSCQTLLQHRRH
jgi:hypothetical protein